MKSYLIVIMTILSLILFTPNSWAKYNQVYDQHPWSATYYYGLTGKDVLIHIFEGEFHRWPEKIQSLELAYTLDKNNVLRQFFQPLVSVVQVANILSLRQGHRQHNIIEVSPYLVFRWTNFPWNQYINTSLALGEGISYTSSIPNIERKDNTHTKRLLNYLMFEASFALPQYPRLQFIARIHHRSGAYGLYRAGNTGSNIVGIGIRYLFD